jgi:hypothetical protein
MMDAKMAGTEGKTFSRRLLEFAENHCAGDECFYCYSCDYWSNGCQHPLHPNNWSENQMVCEICGCTDDRACPGGCSWVRPGLCSQCVGKMTPLTTSALKQANKEVGSS